jgi:hypothetical protein
MNRRKLIILLFLTFLFGIILPQNVSFSQSKKQQIEALNFKIDSVNQVIAKERNTHKSSIGSLEIQESKSKHKVDSLIKEINSVENHNNSQLNNKQIIKSELSRLKKEIDLKKDSLKRLSNPKNYLDKLPRGFKMTGPNGEEGERCYSDLDGDGINDLVILLFSEEESGGLITIFLSTNFYKRYEFQYFEWIWISYTMGEINCKNGIIEIYGGQTDNDISVGDEVNLSFNNQQRKMVINFAERKTYKLDKLIESENMDYIVLKTGVID